MRYCLIFVVVLVTLLVLMGFQDRDKPAPRAPKPVVIYRQIPAPRPPVNANLEYLAEVAERQELRRRYKTIYGKECPY